MKQASLIGVTALILHIAAGCISPAYSNAKETHENSQPIVTRITIEIYNVPGDTTKWVEIARSLILLRQGEPFFIRQLEDSLNALKSSNIFKEIHVPDPKREKDGFSFLFRLVPFRRVKDIKVSGAFPVFEREILNAMSLYPGDVFRKEDLHKHKTAIEDVFRKQGYVAPTIDVTAEEDPKDGNYIVYVNIKKGGFYRLEQVDIEGNHAFSDLHLKMRTKTWISSMLTGNMRRFRSKEFEKDMKKLVRFYRKKQYPEVALSHVVKKDPETKKVHLFITIDEGPKYDIRFSGNKTFWDLTLKKDLVLFKEGNKNDSGLRKSIRLIKQRYRKSGFLDTKISMRSERTEVKGKSVRKILLSIEEGKQSIVGSINITGNNEFDEKTIRNQMLTRTPGILNNGSFVPETLKEDSRAIASLYSKQGYMVVDVKEEVNWQEEKDSNIRYAHITLSIEEGVQTIVSDINITGLNALAETEAIESLSTKKGLPFSNDMIQKDENTLASLVSEKGYPHVKVTEATMFREDRSKAAATFNVDEGPEVDMGQIIVLGNFLTKAKIIQREIELSPGEPLSLEKMLRSQKNIRDLNIFDSVKFKILGLKEQQDEVDLFVKVEEKKPYYIQAGVGYDSEREFYALAEAGDHNLFGMNKDIWANIEGSRIGQKGEIGISEPRFLGTRIKSIFSLFAEKKEDINQDFGTDTYGASLSFNRKFLKFFTADLSFIYNRRDKYQLNSGLVSPADDEEYDPRGILVTKPSLMYNSTDSFNSPKKGIFSILSLDFSKGVENSLDNFLKYRLEMRYYYTPWERLTLAVRGRAGYIDPTGSDSIIPEDQLFYLGGVTSVRGFEKNLLRFNEAGKAVGGRQEILANIESRIYLGYNLELTAFFDTGSIGETFYGEGSGDFRHSAGLGLSYITPLSPIGIVYGHKLDRKEGESSGEFHFSLGFTF